MTFNIRSAYSIFLISFFFHLAFIFQGIDVTDTGFHLTHQVESFASKVDVDSIYPMVFLSDFIGGIWLKIINGPSLLWARLGGVLLYALNTTIIFSILSSYFERNKSFIIVLITSVFITIRFGIDIFDYYTFPAFLLNLQLWIFHKLIRPTVQKRTSISYGFMLGFLAVPIILCRLPLCLIIITPVLMFLYYIFSKKNLSRPLQLVILSSIGFICSFILFGLLYRHLGLQTLYPFHLFSGLNTQFSTVDKYGPIALLYRYVTDIIIITVATLLTILGLYLISILGCRTSYQRASTIIISTPILLFIIFFLFGDYTDYLAYCAIYAITGIVLLLIALFFYIDKGTDTRLTLLLIAGLVVMIVNPIGSATGLIKTICGMWLILPLSFLCTDKIINQFSNKTLSGILSYSDAFLMSLLISSLLFHFTNIYRDDQNRFHLNTAFSHVSLAGIYSTPQRVRVIDETLSTIEKYTEKNDEVLMVNSIPLFYYLTKTKPALKNPWIVSEALEMIISRQQDLVKKRRYPKLFVYAKLNMRDRKWPETDSICRPQDKLNVEYLKNEYITNLKYVLYWQNKAFAIYGRPEDLSH